MKEVLRIRASFTGVAIQRSTSSGPAMRCATRRAWVVAYTLGTTSPTSSSTAVTTTTCRMNTR